MDESRERANLMSTPRRVSMTPKRPNNIQIQHRRLQNYSNRRIKFPNSNTIAAVQINRMINDNINEAPKYVVTNDGKSFSSPKMELKSINRDIYQKRLRID